MRRVLLALTVLLWPFAAIAAEFSTLAIVDYPFTIKGSSNSSSSHEAFDFYMNAVPGGDAKASGGSGAAQEFPPQLAIGYNRDPTLDIGSVLYLQRAASETVLGGSSPWLFNDDNYVFQAQGSWPSTSDEVANTNDQSIGGTSAGNHAPQNVVIFQGHGFGDTTAEIDADGGMIHALYVVGQAANSVYPKYLAQLVSLGSGSDSIGLDINHYGIPQGGELFGIENGAGVSLFEIVGPKNAPGGSLVSGGGYADGVISGNFSVGGGLLVQQDIQARHVRGAGVPSANSCAGFYLANGSSDLAGAVSYTNSTTCSVTFAAPFINAPFCTIGPGTAPSTIQVDTSTTGFWVYFGTAQAFFYYQCLGI